MTFNLPTTAVKYGYVTQFYIIDEEINYRTMYCINIFHCSRLIVFF